MDAVVSPGGTMLLGFGTAARGTYGLAQSRVLPRLFTQMNKRTGIPTNAPVFNLLIAVFFLLVFQSWQGLVASLGFSFAVGYAVTAVAASASSEDPRLVACPWMKRGMPTVSALTFSVSGLLMYWSGWGRVWIGVALFMIPLPIGIVVMMRDRKVFTLRLLVRGLWFPLYLLVILGFSVIGSFGGAGVLAARWVSIVVAIVSVFFFWWGQRDSVAWLASKEAESAAGVYH